MFRYDRRLKDNPEAKELINRAWKTTVDKSVHGRIAIVRTALIEWSKQRFLNSRTRIEEKKAELEKALTDPANDRELINTVTNELNAAYESEEEYWRQRSRVLWLSLGDKNSGYFHAVSKNRKRRNAITVLEDSEGTPVFKEEQIGQVVVSYFQKLFESVEGNREETVNYALSPMISGETNERLTQIPTAIEIKEALF